MCLDPLPAYDVPIRGAPIPELEGAIRIRTDGSFGYQTDWFTLGRAYSIARCKKCHETFAAPDARFFYDTDIFENVFAL